MIIKGITDPVKQFRKAYPLEGENIRVKHFVVRTLTPDNPFGPHKHEQEELWYILEGNAILSLEGKEYPVGPEDLIHLKPWIEHGLSTETNAKWICLG